MNLIIKPLKWDSIFFGLKIGQAEIDNERASIKLNKDVFSDFDLVYLFVDDNIKIDRIPSDFVDTKIVFKRDLSNFAFDSKYIEEYSNWPIDQKMYELAYESGQFSRFKLDEKFMKGSFEQFYSTWLENSINKEIADYVFVYRKKGQILGFVTLKLNNGIGEIGLIAVDKYVRGSGVGSQLLRFCEKELIKKGIKEIIVATQKRNSNAVAFYLKNGYSVKSSKKIFHIWKE